MRRIVSLVILSLLLVGTFALAFNVGLVHAQAETIYINSDGSVSPSDAPISSVDNVTYTFTGNITTTADTGIVVERPDTTLDGAGFSLVGSGNYTEGISVVGIWNVTVTNLTVTGFDDGITLSESQNCTIINCQVDGNIGIFGSGIRLLSGCSGIYIASNLITNNLGGVHVEDADNNSIVNNLIAYNKMVPASYTGAGIDFYQSDNNTVTCNTIKDNAQYGIINFGYCNGNVITHNNFINNNPAQVWWWDNSPTVFDCGYPSGGNYWSDYQTVYPNASEINGSGIWNTPYVVDASNQDNYPLMKPYPLIPYDLGITNMVASKSVVGQGFALNISTTIFNYGSNAESFNVTVYANTTIIGTFINVTSLASGDNTIISLIWNTTDFAYGSYHVSAYAWTVSVETDMEDNNFTCGVVNVTIPGDVDDNGVVNMGDVMTLLYAFGSTPGQPNWNPNCDIEGNGRIDMGDIVIALRNFGQHYP